MITFSSGSIGGLGCIKSWMKGQGYMESWIMRVDESWSVLQSSCQVWSDHLNALCQEGIAELWSAFQVQVH